MARNIILGLTATALLTTLGSLYTMAQAQQEQMSHTDQLLIRAQKICPVSGQDLTSKGGPIKALSGNQLVFLCCEGCFGQQIPQKHWEQVNTNLAAAQKKCPVMDKPLPEKPQSVVVQYRTLFICCEGCSEKIQAEPDKHIATTDELLRENLKE